MVATGKGQWTVEQRGTTVRVLVSPGTGEVGGLVAGMLRAAGHEAIDASDVRGAHIGDMGDIDAVWHEPGVRPTRRGFDDAIEASERSELELALLLRSLHGAAFSGRVVVMSSACVYGETAILCSEHGPVSANRWADDLARGVFDPLCPYCRRHLSGVAARETSPTHPHQPAAAASLHHEHLWSSYAWEHPDTTVTALRCSGIYGPGMPVGDEGGVIGACLAHLEAGRQPVVLEDGNQLRDFLHVTDAARAALAALTVATPFNGPLNIGSGRPVTVIEMVTMLCVASGTSAWPLLSGEVRSSDVRHLTIDPGLARDVLGFRARMPLADGLADVWRQHLDRLSVPA